MARELRDISKKALLDDLRKAYEKHFNKYRSKPDAWPFQVYVPLQGIFYLHLDGGVSSDGLGKKLIVDLRPAFDKHFSSNPTKWDSLVGRKPISINDTEIHTWFERDRSHVELRNNNTQETIIEWWDDDVHQAVEDGFLNARDWHGSAYEYAKEMGMLNKKRQRVRKNPARSPKYRGKHPFAIKTIYSIGQRGVVQVTANNGLRTNVHASSTGGAMPKVGEDIRNFHSFETDPYEVRGLESRNKPIQSLQRRDWENNPTKLRPLGANQTELETDDGATVLFSYQTPVAIHIPGRGYFRTDKQWSQTTAKHITKWLRANGANKVGTVPQEHLDKIVQSSAASHEFKKNPRSKRRLIEIAEQAGMLGWHVFVDGMYDADIRPSNTAHDALRKAYKVYPRTGQYKNMDFSYYSDVYENPRISVPRERIAQWAGSRVKRKRAMERTLPAKRGGHVHVQQKRGAMWFTLAVSSNTEKGRLMAKDWALRYHRRHPGTELRLFV